MQVRGTILLLSALGALNFSLFPSQPHPAALPEFVACRGQQLLRNGAPFRFVGVNCYRLAELAPQADQIFSTLSSHGVKVVRFWAFQKRCGPSGRDFSTFDALVAAAKRHDILLLPVLENHWKQCTFSGGQEWKPREWYEAGWRANGFFGAPLSYRAYIRALAEHFRDEPQILGWQLMNEPEIYPDTDENAAMLQTFARQAARALRQADPNHLISVGLLGLGQPATTGGRFRALHNAVEIDVVSAHDHGYIYEPMAGRGPSRRENSFYSDLWAARSLNKPFVATESGIALHWVNGDRANRAELFRAKMRAFFEAGGAGFILWNYEPFPDTAHGFDASDPVMEIIADVAALL